MLIYSYIFFEYVIRNLNKIYPMIEFLFANIGAIISKASSSLENVSLPKVHFAPVDLQWHPGYIKVDCKI